MSARIPDHAGRPVVPAGLLIAFGYERRWYIYVRNGRGWVWAPDETQAWRELGLNTPLPGLGGEVLTGGRRETLLQVLGEPTP